MASGLVGSGPRGHRVWVCAGQAGDWTLEQGCSQKGGAPEMGRSAFPGAVGARPG